MGGTIGSNKDGFIDMIIQINNPLYTAGQFVDGLVHVNCKDSRNYRALQIKLSGTEYVSWSQGGKHRRHYSNRKQTYNYAFNLAIFADNIIAAGQYTFPFRFLLPSQLSGSMFQSESCYIRYYLSCQLLPSDDKNQVQTFSRVINILQPQRREAGMIQKQQINTPQCCNCCASYGTVKISMNCDKSIVKGGDQIRVTVFVDNTAGEKDVQNIQIHFSQKRWKISSGGAIRNHTSNNNSLYVHPKVILPGQTDQFTFTSIIPSGWIYSTAIGSILSKYHVLTLNSHIGCCSMGATCQFLLFYQSAGQQIQISPKTPPPAIWMPKIAPEVVFTGMVPFIYSPSISMPYVNRLNAIAMMNNMMPTDGGYYQNNQGNTSNGQMY